MVKSRRNASSSGVPNVLSRWMHRRGRGLAVRVRRARGARAGSGSCGGPCAGVASGGPAEATISATSPAGSAAGSAGTFFRNVATSIVFGAELDVREPEAPADDPAVPEQPLDLVRVRVGADVEVLRPAAEQQVADAAADEVGDVVAAAEAGTGPGARRDRCSGAKSGGPRAGRRPDRARTGL